MTRTTPLAHRAVPTAASRSRSESTLPLKVTTPPSTCMAMFFASRWAWRGRHSQYLVAVGWRHALLLVVLMT